MMKSRNKQGKPLSLRRIKKKAKKYVRRIGVSNILLGIAGSAIVSGLILAAIRSKYFDKSIKAFSKSAENERSATDVSI